MIIPKTNAFLTGIFFLICGNQHRLYIFRKLRTSLSHFVLAILISIGLRHIIIMEKMIRI